MTTDLSYVVKQSPAAPKLPILPVRRMVPLEPNIINFPPVEPSRRAARCLLSRSATVRSNGRSGAKWPYKLFRRLFLTRLIALHDAGRLAFFGGLAPLADRSAFLRHLSPVRHQRWVVYAKPPFAGPEAVLAYLSRYTHRVAISNRRLLAFDEAGVTFRYKDYRRDGAHRQRVMTLGTDEFIRRFLLHLLPRGFHRIRHYGLLSASARRATLARARELIAVAPPSDDDVPEEPLDDRPPCPCCGGRMIIIETFQRGMQPRAPPVCPTPTGTVTP